MSVPAAWPAAMSNAMVPHPRRSFQPRLPAIQMLAATCRRRLGIGLVAADAVVIVKQLAHIGTMVWNLKRTIRYWGAKGLMATPA
ncbi:hypothetical protein H9654_05595 [Stenotrophomonas sp. Sa5BUN4]|uniref:Uncharacterized protein n=1 Tax=Stenotrophomonas lacuserhaii TaxID=2760084 RepID=A0A8X8K1Q1_9GAMM|nr:hypothetical protein [Stenotrophomonas pennii]MBD7953679.1 hypothetical protein [Stenotrophomonas pennii]